MSFSPPSYIYCTIDEDQEQDESGLDHSDVTWRRDGEVPHAEDLSAKIASDSCLNSSMEGKWSHQDENQELVELKLQIARQQEVIDTLESKLSACQIENEALKAENEALVNDIALPIPEQASSRRKCFEEDTGGPVQFLLDANSKLEKDNARLQVIVDVTKKSYQSSIKDNQRKSREAKKTVNKLQRENEALRQTSDCQRKTFTSVGTAQTSLETFFTQEGMQFDSSSRYTNQDSSVGMTFEEELKMIEDFKILEDMESAKNSPNEYVQKHRCRSMITIDVKKPAARTKRATIGGESEELLVDFGDRQSFRNWTSFGH